MKNLLFFTIVAFIAIGFTYYFSGTKTYNSELEWKNFSEGLKISKEEKKKMLVNVYTVWCGWCKKMESGTYTDSLVIKYLNEKFVSVKLNAESGDKHLFEGTEYTERQIAQGLGASSYPTTLFFDENNQAITLLPGYLDGEKFLDVLVYIGDNYYKEKSFEEFLSIRKPYGQK